MYILPVCMYLVHVPGTYRGQRRVLDPLKLELCVVVVVVNCRVCARNGTQFSLRATNALSC